MSLYELVNKLAVLLAGRNPNWSEQTDYTGPPAATDAGVKLENAPRTLIHIAMREDVARPSSRVQITAGDAATTYSITVDGNASSPATVTGLSDPEDIQQDLTAALLAAPAVTALVDVDVPDTDTILIQSKTADVRTIAVNATGGAGTIALTNDASAAKIRLYALPKGSPSWVLVRDGVLGEIDGLGWLERFDTAGFERIYVELYDVTGDNLTVSIGPGMDEVS